MMKQIIFAIFAAALLLVGMTGCSKVDNPSTDDTKALEQSLVGLWWDAYEYADVTEAGVPYTRVLMAVLVNADHTGCLYMGAFNDDSDEPVAVYGGPEAAGFRWQLLADGRVLLSDPVTGETYVMARTRADGGNYGKEMTNVANTKVDYANGSMTVTNDNYSGTLAKADAEKEAEIRKKLKELIANVNSGDAGIGYGGPGNGSAHARRLGDI